MKNERLIALMEAKGVSKSTLSSLSHIPLSTLSRIVNGETIHVKANYMQAIASALNTSIYSVFDLPVEMPLVGGIRPEEAGDSITKLLSPDESLLLFWYQNSLQDGRVAIYNKAKSEYMKTLTVIDRKAAGFQPPTDDDAKYEQLTFETLNTVNP